MASPQSTKGYASGKPMLRFRLFTARVSGTQALIKSRKSSKSSARTVIFMRETTLFTPVGRRATPWLRAVSRVSTM